MGFYGHSSLLKGGQCVPTCDALQWFNAMVEKIGIADELGGNKHNSRS